MTGGARTRVLTAPQAVGWSVLFLVGGFGLTIALAAAGAFLTGGINTTDTVRLLVLQSVGGLIAFGFLTWLVGLRLLRLDLVDLRYAPFDGAGRGFGMGLALGALPAVAAVALSMTVGGARFVDDTGTLVGYGLRLGATTLLLAPAALLEEVMFRGVSQVLLARAIGRWPAILALALVFALAHAFNPNGTPLGLVNIGLAGLFLGAAFYAPGGLWTAWGAHLGWNTALAAMDAPVSGLPFPIPLIDYEPGGPAWLTGGPFGPEGGLVATVAIGLATAAAWRWGRKESLA